MKEIFEKLGLGKKERRVYIACLKRGPAPASKIALEAGLPRQTTYSILSRLIEEGLVEQSDRAGVRSFFADPRKIPSVLERRQTKLAETKRAVEEKMAELLSMKQSVVEFPKVEYYEGEEGIKRFSEEILEYYKKKNIEKVLRGYGVNKFSEGLGDYFAEHAKKRAELGVETRLLVGKGETDLGLEDELLRKWRQVRQIEMNPQESGVYLVGSRIYLFSYKDKVGVMIENEAIAELLKNTFDDHWQRVEK